MAINIDISQSTLFISVAGNCRLSDIKEAQTKALLIIREKAIQNVLLDLRKAAVDLSALDIYELTTNQLKHFPGELKYGVVYDPETGDASNIKFFENLAANRGIQAKAFADYQQALNWLNP